MKLIVAVDENDGISKNGAIPWNYPEDQQFFRFLTVGDKVAMGSKTWDTLHKPLYGRYNMVVTNNQSLLWSESANSHKEFGFFELDAALAEADWIIGGEQLYLAALAAKEVSQIYITRVTGDYGCDKFFRIPEGYKQVAEHFLSDFCRVEKWIR